LRRNWRRLGHSRRTGVLVQGWLQQLRGVEDDAIVGHRQVGDLREEQRAEQEHQQQLHSWQHGSPVFFTLFGIN